MSKPIIIKGIGKRIFFNPIYLRNKMITKMIAPIRPRLFLVNMTLKVKYDARNTKSRNI
jgi:hypothetical protein